MRQFFANARQMLLPGGEVHVSHKLGHPYVDWKLEEQARVSGLELVKRVFFRQEHFPGYHNCLGDGSKAGESFKLGPAYTFIFAARSSIHHLQVVKITYQECWIMNLCWNKTSAHSYVSSSHSMTKVIVVRKPNASELSFMLLRTRVSLRF